MKKPFLLILFYITCFAQAQQVLNPGFENWPSGFPQDWGTVSQALVNNGKANPNLEVKTLTAHSGSSAILLQTQSLAIAGANNVPGSVCTGNIIFNGGPIFGYAPYNFTPLSYSFWYLYNAPSGDDALTKLYITKWNSTNNNRDTLATASALIYGPVSNYTQQTVPITWLNTTQTPDSIQLLFTSSKTSFACPAGGKLYIDDVNMNFSATAIESFNTTVFNLFPNPTNNMVTVKTDGQIGTLTIYNCLGEMVVQTKSLNNIEQIDVSGLAPGIYTVQAQNKFIKLVKK